MGRLGFVASAKTATVLMMVCTSLALHGVSLVMADPTDGFTEVQLQMSDLVIQWPYDLPRSARYSFLNGVHRMWVYVNDKPFQAGSNTMPRTEIRIKNHDYSSGVWQFEGNVYVPSGTSGVAIAQIFGADPQIADTTLQLRVYGGQLMYYNSKVLWPSSIYDQWFRINMIHDVGAGTVSVYINGTKQLGTKDRGGDVHYFKCGVYAQNGASNYMESRWKGIRILKK